MGLQGVATARVVPVPGRLPAPLGLGLEAGCHPGELHLVTEEPAPDTPVFVLPPPKGPVGVDPRPAQPLALLSAGGRPLLGRGVAQFVVRGPLVEQLQEISAGLGALAQGLGHEPELGRRQLPVVQGLGQQAGPWRPAPPRPGVLWPPRPRSPRAPPASRPPVPWPPLVYSPVSTTRGAKRATPAAATRSASLNRVTNWRAAAPDRAAGTGHRTTSRMSRIARSTSANRVASEGVAASIGSVAETT